MHLEQFAREALDDLLGVVEDHVEREIDPGLGRDRADVVVDRIALADGPGRLGAPDPPRVMQRQGGLEPGQPRRHQLRAAAESCEEVRLDEAGRDLHVGVGPAAVQPDRHPVADHPAPAQAVGVAGVVVYDPHRARELAEHLAQLLGGVSAVSPGGDQQRECAAIGDPVELANERPDHRLAWLRARQVADRDGDRVASVDELPQPRAGDRVLHGISQRRGRVGSARSRWIGDTTAVRSSGSVTVRPVVP